MRLAIGVAVTISLNAVLDGLPVAVAASHQSSSPAVDRQHLQHVAELQLKADLSGAAQKLQAILTDVDASYQKTRAHIVTVRDHCKTQASESSVRMQTQESKSSSLQETREVNLQKQAEADATLDIMKTAMDEKVASYQSSVAQRAKEATSFHSWNNANTGYVEALDGAVDILSKSRDSVDAASLTHLAHIKGILVEQRRDAASKTEELTTKHTGQDADYETLVNSYRQALADSEDAYTTKRQQRDDFFVAAQGAMEERDIRDIAKTGEAMVLDTMVQLCGTEGSELNAAKIEGDASLLTVQSSVVETDARLKEMPDVAVTFLALPPKARRENASPQTKSMNRQEDMKRLAAEIRNKKGPPSPHTFLGHRRALQAPRKAVAMKRPATVGHAIVKTSPSLGHLATSAVAVARHTMNATPASNTECVKEKQRIASEITALRKEKQEAESQKTIADTRGKSIVQEISVANDAKDKFDAASNSFSSTWLPLMTDIGSDTYNQEMTAAIAKMDEVDSDIDDYIKQGGPPAASALPLAAKRSREAITALRDGVQKDLAKVEKLYTGSLMVAYPKITGDLDDKVTALNAEKEQASKDLNTASQDSTNAQTKADQLKNEWDQVEAACAHYLKGGT